MGQLSSVDATFLNIERGKTVAHVGGLAILEPPEHGALRRQDVIRLIRERAHLARPLRRRLVRVPFGLDHPYWADDPEFDPEEHVHEITMLDT